MARRKRSSGYGAIRALNMLAFLPIASRTPLYGRLIWALAVDPRVPTSRKVLLGLAAVYVVSPIDLIPERIPIVGALDDVAVVVLAFDLFLDGLPESLVREKLDELGIPHEELEADLRRIRRLVPKPLRKVAARLPDAIEGVIAFARERGLDRRLRGLLAGQPSARPAQRSAPAQQRATESNDPTSSMEVSPA